MKILVIEPGHKPRPEEISGSIKSIQEIVGGEFQAEYPEENIALVYNKAGLFLRLPPNREIPDSNGELADIVYGSLIVCGAPIDRNHFASLTEKQLREYSDLFATPQTFLNLGGRIIAFPAGEVDCH